jgi:hypothetical protein
VVKPSQTQFVSRARADETPEAGACRFQSLTLEERADWLCEFTDFVLGKQLQG